MERHTERFGALLLLPAGATYRGTPKQYSVVSVLKNRCIIANGKVDVNVLYSRVFRKKQAHATTIRLDLADREAMARMRELYGCPSDRAALKLALRMVARAIGVPTQAPNKERPFYPHV